MKRYLLNRMKEPSTWRGIILIFTSLGYNIDPEMGDAIITTGLALAGLVGALTGDKYGTSS